MARKIYFFSSRRTSYTFYTFYAYGKEDDLVDIDPLYQGLGRTEKERQSRDQRGFGEESRANLNVRFLGSDSFVEELGAKFGVKNLKNRRGRPAKVNK